MKFLKSLAVSAALALSLGAQAQTLTAQSSTLGITPGGEAVARFNLDFGPSTPFISLQFDFLFDTGLLAGKGEDIALSFALNPPDYSGGVAEWGQNAEGASWTWVWFDGDLPSAEGVGVLSIKLSDLGLAAPTTLTARVTIDDTLLVQQLDVIPVAVPEPASWALALCGGCLLIAVRRRVSA